MIPGSEIGRCCCPAGSSTYQNGLLDGMAADAMMDGMKSLSNPGAPVNGTTRIRPGRRTALRQALELQERVFAEGIKLEVKPMELAQLARAWDCLEDRKRIIRGHPLPGSLKPEKRQSRGADQKAVEPIE